MNRNDIASVLDVLIGQPFSAIGRASNMLWLGFGGAVPALDYRGRPVTRSHIALHVQCPWRITSALQTPRILLSQGDIYRPKDGIEDDEDFQWEPQGHNLFDVRRGQILSRLQGCTVADYHFSRYCDLTILLSNQDAIEIFVDETGDRECWRLFQNGPDLDGTPHLVICGNTYISATVEAIVNNTK